MANINAAKKLFKNDDVKVWNEAKLRYSDSVARVAETKKKMELIDLDGWLHTKFSKSLTQKDGRTPKKDAFTKDMLVKIMTWKLTRGKFRPLIGKVQSNTEPSVKKAWNEVVSLYESEKYDGSCLDIPLEAVNKISALHGIGTFL